jgi:multidrug efflux pump subunit AcrA (membrane-fusion protein)
MSGIVSDRAVNIGEMASSGSALLSIVDISQVVARANIPIQEAAAMNVGDPATISGAGVKLAGKITVVSPAVDPNTTTLQVWVGAPNPEERMKLGLTESKVETGVRDGDNVQILSGVKPGDQVITEGGLGLDDKAKIEIAKPGGEEGSGKRAGEAAKE